MPIMPPVLWICWQVSQLMLTKDLRISLVEGVSGGMGRRVCRNGSSILDDRNVEIYPVSRMTPEYVVIGQN